MKKFLWTLVFAVMAAGCGGEKTTESSLETTPAKNQGGQTAALVSSTPSPKLALGIAALHKGDIKNAIISFEQAIRQNPKDVEAYILLGQTYMHLKDYNRSIETFVIASKVAPNNGQIHYLLATNFGLAGNIKMAEVEAQKSLAIFRQQKDEANFKRAVALIRGLPAAQADKSVQE